jgi:hypothetical protein
MEDKMEMQELIKSAKAYLTQQGAFEKNENRMAQKFVSILDEEVPYKMALAIANFSMASLAGHFHAKLALSETNTPPINMIGFILAKSGAKKTSSVIKMEKAMRPGLDVVEHVRKERELEKAKLEGIPARTLKPLSNALSTVPGLLANLNDFKDEGIGLPSMIVDEVSTALAVNPDFVPNVEVISQLFDDGDCKVKIIKDQELQSEPVYGMGMNGLFIGSEKGILEDASILRKFLLEFISKLGRRCYFVYPMFKEEKVNETDILKRVKLKREKKEFQDEAMKEIGTVSGRVAGKLLKQEKVHIELDDEALELWEVYEEYCDLLAKQIDEDNEVEQLEQAHRHWKMIKLAGAYAIWNESEKITKKEVLEAIYSAELSAKDIGKFVAMAKNLPYEKLVHYFLEGGQPLTYHDLVKKEWLKSTKGVEEMVGLANSKLAGEGQIQVLSGKLSYEKYNYLDKDEDLPVSFKMLPPLDIDKYKKMGMDEKSAYDAAKQERSFSIVDGYTVKTTKWDKLANLLSHDCVFNPHQFQTLEEGATTTLKNPTGGIRGKDNIKSHASFIILDVDDSDITIDEARDMLQDYRYHMARTSNKDNPYKFRILLQSDIAINVDGTKWKELIKAIARYLDMLAPDDLPQSQGIFGYNDREVYSNEGDLVPVSEIIQTLRVETKVQKKVTPQERDLAWANREEVFWYAYQANVGFHDALFRAMKQAFDMGFSYDLNEELTDDINEKNPHRTMRSGFERSLESQRKETYGRE